jgi:hypothetical protein
MPDQLASSPLKVVVSNRGSIMTATDPAGNVVLDGVRGKRAKPLAAVQTTAANTWTIEHRAKGSAPVYDAAGVAVAEIRRTGTFRNDVIVAGDGSEIEVAKRARRISFGSPATAKPALLRPITHAPLTVSVTEFGTHMSATDPDDNVVVDGARTTSRDPSVPSAVLTTASGQWAIGRRATGNGPVYDAAGVPVAEIRITGEWKFDIVTGDGTAGPDHEMLVAVLVNLAREQIRVAAVRASQNSGSASLPA